MVSFWCGIKFIVHRIGLGMTELSLWLSQSDTSNIVFVFSCMAIVFTFGALVGRSSKLLACFYPMNIKFDTFGDFVTFFPDALSKEKYKELFDHFIISDEYKKGWGIEIFTGLLSVVLVWFLLFPFIGITTDKLIFVSAFLSFTYLLIVASVIDVKSLFLPDHITISLLWLGLGFTVFGYSTLTMKESFIGVVAGYCSLWLVNKVLGMFKIRLIGGGDIKLFAAIGAWIGYSPLPVILAISCLVGIVLTISKVVNKNKEPVPFGQNLAIAAWVIAFSHYISY